MILENSEIEISLQQYCDYFPIVLFQIILAIEIIFAIYDSVHSIFSEIRLKYELLNFHKIQDYYISSQIVAYSIC